MTKQILLMRLVYLSSTKQITVDVTDAENFVRENVMTQTITVFISS